MKVYRLLIALAVCFTFISQIQARGKTYDDLDDILKHDGLNSSKTHIAYKEPLD